MEISLILKLSQLYFTFSFLQVTRCVFFVFAFGLVGCLKAMENRPYHHLPDGGFRNPEGSPERSASTKWSYWVFNREKKKLDMKIGEGHAVEVQKVLERLGQSQGEDYVLWIGHATFLMKLGDTTLITDPFFSQNAGPFLFGPKRYVQPAIPLNKLPKVDLVLLTHNHYDHLDLPSLTKFPSKESKVLVPLGLSRYFVKRDFKDVSELDWYENVQIDKDLKITFLPAVHWSKRTLIDTNKTLWGSFLIQHKGKKIFFSCDTGYGPIYKKLGDSYGPIDLTFINIGAYDFRPMFDHSVYHTTPEEALMVARDLNSSKVIGMHWGTVVLSLEPIMEPPIRFKKFAGNYNFQTEDAIVMPIGGLELFSQLLR